MRIEQIYTKCLAQGAYYIVSDFKAAIIDPLRDITPYIERAKEDGVKIEYIFETHFHADFVSGHIHLAKETGAKIIYGPGADPTFDAHIAKDNEKFKLGKTTIKCLHTPGHTMESTCYLLYDENGMETAIFTGDTLFLGDVGRPDLAQKNEAQTVEDQAGFLFDSLRTKIMPLPNHVTVYPAHGAGSACGKFMMKETKDTLGNQKKINYALRENMDRKEFIEELTNGLLPPPAYFPANVQMNKEGYQNINSIIKKGLKPLKPKELKHFAQKNNALILDIRSPLAYSKGHIPSSMFVGLDGNFAPWVGELVVDVKRPILIVAEEGREEEGITRLSRVGFDNTLGYLSGGIDAWKDAKMETDTVASISADRFSEKYGEIKKVIFDVRKETEFKTEHIVGAHNTPLNQLNEYIDGFPQKEPFYIHCAGGYRSMIACSILKSKNIHHLYDVQGGFSAIKKTNIPM